MPASSGDETGVHDASRSQPANAAQDPVNDLDIANSS